MEIKQKYILYNNETGRRQKNSLLFSRNTARLIVFESIKENSFINSHIRNIFFTYDEAEVF